MTTASATDAALRARQWIESSARRPVLRYAILALQLAPVLYLASRRYQLQGMAFQKLALMVFAGFTVNYFLPVRHRPAFFAFLSLTGVLVIFGMRQGPWLIGTGLILLGLAHLPVSFRARIGLLLSAGLLLAVLRQGRLHVPWPAAIWPVLASMFMLRIIIYLYDLGHRTAPFSIWRGLGYFFMLPNVCFPLFPVVDYQTFCRTYHDAPDRDRACQVGIQWMARGVVQLILYRVVYRYLPIDTTAVTNVAQLLRYVLWPFLLYLQVSGLFHLATGMMHLFGFNLPETNHLYYLSGSFTDLWRRINIYWKDFMMKVFYYPAYFKLRRFGTTRALVLGTLWVFGVTWLLHAYQWFWIRGTLLLKSTDALFWSVLAVLVAGNVVFESRRPGKRRLAAGVTPIAQSARAGLRAFAVFVVVCLLWSLWISRSLSEWLSLFGVLRDTSLRDLRLVPLVAAAALVFVLASIWFDRWERRPYRASGAIAECLVTIAVLLIVSWPRFYQGMEWKYAWAIQSLRTPALNDRDKVNRQRDYYEKLTDVGWENPDLWKVYLERPPDWVSVHLRADLSRETGSLPYVALIPNAGGRHRGTIVRFNRWGMRDRDYAMLPPPGVYRICLEGSSLTFGSGVPHEETFEDLVEERLDREAELGAGRRVEILNFSIEGYSALDVLADLDQRVFQFKPDAVFYVVHLLDAQRGIRRLAALLAKGAPLPYPLLDEFAIRAGIREKVNEPQAIRMLEPYKTDLLEQSYQEIADRCRAHGVLAVMVFLPTLSEYGFDLQAAEVMRMGRAAGFEVLDLSGVYADHDRLSLYVASWDDHPNATGHRLVADRLYAGIRENVARLHMECSGPALEEGSNGSRPLDLATTDRRGMNGARKESGSVNLP